MNARHEFHADPTDDCTGDVRMPRGLWMLLCDELDRERAKVENLRTTYVTTRENVLRILRTWPDSSPQ